MNIDRRCDQCGREMEKAHRIYKGLSYCSTCYAREFKSKTCPKCGAISRLLVKDPDAICGRCEKDKPCVRCGKEKYSIGLISIYGPVCKSCARYFSEPKPCSCVFRFVRPPVPVSSGQAFRCDPASMI